MRNFYNNDYEKNISNFKILIENGPRNGRKIKLNHRSYNFRQLLTPSCFFKFNRIFGALSKWNEKNDVKTLQISKSSRKIFWLSIAFLNFGNQKNFLLILHGYYQNSCNTKISYTKFTAGFKSFSFLKGFSFLTKQIKTRSPWAYFQSPSV